MAGPRAPGGRRWRGAIALAALAIPGFGLGVLAGLVWEEPGLVASYVIGRTEAVGWGPGAAAGEPRLPAVAAPGDASDPAESEPAPAAPEPGAPAAEPPPEPARPAVSRPVAARPQPGFVVQVGAFRERAGADGLAAELRAKGYRVRVSEGEAGAARWRVRVGPSPSREAAEQTATRLKQAEKLPTWVLEEGG